MFKFYAKSTEDIPYGKCKMGEWFINNLYYFPSGK